MRSARRVVPATLTVLAYLACPQFAAAQTSVSGTLSTNTTWTLAQSPIVVTGTVQVPAGVTLTVEPSVVVQFEAAQGLEVSGTLIARGTPNAKIRFTAAAAAITPGHWFGVHFRPGSVGATLNAGGGWVAGSVLEHVIIEGAGDDYLFTGSVDLDDARPLIDSVLIRNSAGTAIYGAFSELSSAGTITIRNSEFVGLGESAGISYFAAGIDLSHTGNVVIDGNLLHGWRDGIRLSQSDSIPPSPSTPPTVLRDVLVARNTARSNRLNGIRATASAGMRLRVLDNVLTNNAMGLSTGTSWSPVNVEVTGNRVQHNGSGMSVEAYALLESTIAVTHNIISGNGDRVLAGATTSTGRGLYVRVKGTATVTNNVMSGHELLQETGGVYLSLDENASVTFSHNVVVNNVGYWVSGVEAIGGFGTPSFTAIANTVTQNLSVQTTQYAESWATAVSARILTNVIIQGNNIFGNATRFPFNKYALVASSYGQPTANAQGNWWGTTDPALIQTLVTHAPSQPVGGSTPVDAGFPLTGPNTDAPISPPTGLTVILAGSNTSLSWNANPESDVMGYRVWYGAPDDPTYSGTGAAQGPSPIDVGSATSFQLTGLPAGTPVTVTAYDNQRDGVRDQTDGHESWFAPSVRPPLVLTSLTADHTGPLVAFNGSVIFIAQATGGRPPYRYRWSVSHVTNGTGYWSDSNQFYLDAHVPHPYHVSVEVQSVTNLSDNPDNANASGATDFTITPAPLTVSMTSSYPSPQAAGQSIAFSAQAAGGSTVYEYKFRLSTDGGATYSTVRDWNSHPVFLWQTSVPVPNARINVWVRDGGTVDAPQTQFTMPYVITGSTGSLTLVSITANPLSPQMSETILEFTATATGGTAPYQYKFWLYDGTTWRVVRDWSNSNWYLWFPQVVGTYRIGVWVRNAGSTADIYDNNQANGSIEYVLTPRIPTLTSLHSELPSPQAVGTPIRFWASATGGVVPLQYKWRVSLDGGGSYFVAREWNTDASFVWTPTAPTSNARINVWVRRTDISADAPQAELTVPFVVTSTPNELILNSITANLPSPQPTGTSIVFIGNASGGVGPRQYKWWLFNGSWTVLRDWSTNLTFTWTPPLPGTFRIAVWVRSDGNTADMYENANSNGSIEYVVTPGAEPLSVTNVNWNIPPPQVRGTSITFTAGSAGGTTPHQYKWRVSSTGGSTYTTAQDWSTNASFVWTPNTAIADARVSVWVRNSGVTADTPQAQAAVSYVITDPATGPLVLNSIASDLASPQQTGTIVTFTANAIGGTAPYQYKWWLFDGSSWTVTQNWSTSNTLAWTPTAASSAYRIAVWVRNAGNNSDTYENANSNGSIGYTVTPGAAPLSITSLTPNVPSPQLTGTAITFTAAAAGGTAPYQFKWRVSTNGGSTFTTAQDWSSISTVTWTPAGAVADARITVWARNSGNTTDAPQAQATVAYVITTPSAGPLVLNSITSSVASPQQTGTPITFTANATGGTAPYQYKWWLFDGSWNVVSNWSASSTFSWTPSTASSAYRIAVWVRNAGNNNDTYENANSNGSIGYVVTAGAAPLSVNSLTANAASPQAPGTSITFSASASGGTAPYQFKWRVSSDGGGSFTTAQDWSSHASFTWTPASAIAEARISVWARNSGVTADTPQAQATMGYVITTPSAGPLVLNSITSNIASPQQTGTLITFTANASGGTAPYQYKWWVHDGSWNVVSNWSASSTFMWTPSAASSAYRIAVWVRNAGNSNDSFENANSNGSIGYAITSGPPPLAITSLTSNVFPPQAPGTVITFTTTAEGGTAPYQFKWRLSTDGGVSFTTAQDWSANASFTWTPGVLIPVAHIQVWARNSGVTADAPQAQRTVSYIIAAPSPGPLMLNSIVPNLASPRTAGTSVTFTANASGGTGPYQYKWWILDGSWQVVREWSTDSTFTWTPTTPSTAYRVAVWVRNAGSSENLYDNANSNGSIGFVIVP
jgi:hypothetical protein